MRAIFLIDDSGNMRISELLSLKWSQLDFANNWSTIEESRSAECRKVKMNSIEDSALNSIERKGEYMLANSETSRSGQSTNIVHLK